MKNLKIKTRVATRLDVAMAPFSDLYVLRGFLSYSRVVAMCKIADAFKFRGVCVPSKFLNLFKEMFPKLQFITVANFPYNYHPSDVVIREIEAITAIVEDLSRLEIEFLLPSDIKAFVKEFRDLNKLVPLRPVVPFTLFPQIKESLPKLREAFQCLQFGTGFDNKNKPDMPQLLQRVAFCKELGYEIKVCADYKHYVHKELLRQGVKLLGLTNGLSSIRYKEAMIPTLEKEV